MVVLKFGGTSVAGAKPIARAAAIVARTPGPRVVVVSALAGVTDRLLQIARLAEAGRVGPACSMLDRVAARHRDLARTLAGDGAADVLRFIDGTHQTLRALVQAAAVLRDASPRARDAIAASGELMSSRIVAAAFEHLGLPAEWIDARRVVVTDGEHAGAAPRFAPTAARLDQHLRPVVAAGRVPVVGGFIGATVEGITTTLGRGGSDFSAALVGACLDAREIQIWTDVDGLLAADPRIVPDPPVVPQVSFAEARELAYFGAKVLHPSTVEPAVARGIPVRILNSRRPESTGTVVNGAAASGRLALAALACKRGVTVLEIASRRTLRPPVFLRRVFEILDGAALHPCVTTIADTIVVAAFDGDARARQLTGAFAEVADVTIRSEMALLSAVGDGLRGTPRLAADVLAALEGVAVHAVAQPPSGRSLTMLLDEADLPDAMRRVYDRCYAPPAADRAVPVAARG